MQADERLTLARVVGIGQRSRGVCGPRGVRRVRVGLVEVSSTSTASVTPIRQRSGPMYRKKQEEKRVLTSRTQTPAGGIFVVVVGHSLVHAEAVHAHLRAHRRTRGAFRVPSAMVRPFLRELGCGRVVDSPCRTVPAMRSLRPIQSWRPPPPPSTPPHRPPRLPPSAASRTA